MLLTDFLALFPTLVEERDGWLVECPGHADSKPSLRVAVSDKGKVLLRCRAGCETRAVLDAMGLSFGDLTGMDVSGADVVRASSTDAPAGPAEVAALRGRLEAWAQQDYESPALIYSFERFGITPQDAARLGLGYAEDLSGGPRLVVPFRDKQGVARGFQARALDKSAAVRWLGPKSPDGASWARIGWFEGSADWPEVIICEGPGDALTACAVGYDTIGVRGAGLASNASVVADIAEWLEGRVAVIAGDGDPAGRAFSSTLAKSLLAAGARAKILDVPDGLDLTDWRAQAPARFATDFVRAIVQASEQTSTSSALRSRDESAYPLTDLGNARFARDFITSKGSGVRYSPEAGFFLLDGGVWRHDKLDRARTYVQEAADLIAQVADTLFANAATPQELKDAGRWLRWSSYAQSSRGIDSALREMQALPDVAADMADFDRHPDLLACRNGVVNLRTGLLRPHDPALLLTRRIDVDYDQAATCPRWERFLTEVFPNHPGLPGFVQRLVGYGITGSTAEQCFAVLWGTGANGKSVFTDTLTEVFREVTVTTPFSTFEERPSGGIPNDIAALKGARLVMASEGEAGKRMAEAVLKRVTGRDLISARFMRREFFEFKPTFLLFLATNNRPDFRGQDEGLWRRVRLIPWERYFEPGERDGRLGDQLLAEKAGIFAWAVRGAVAWYSGGLGDDKAGSVTAATVAYRESSDVLHGFLPGEYVQDTNAPGVLAPRLFQEFQEWADEHNMIDLKKWSSRAFYRSLEERGVVRKRSTGGKFLVMGLRRSRPTDFDEEERAEAPPLAHSSDTNPAPLSGPSLDSVL